MTCSTTGLDRSSLKQLNSTHKHTLSLLEQSLVVSLKQEHECNENHQQTFCWFYQFTLQIGILATSAPSFFNTMVIVIIIIFFCVICKRSNEMAAVHLTKTYYLPTLMYGCEIWTLTDHSLHTISVAWNNCFWRIFKCCWCDSTKPLQFFCKTMSIAHLADQRKIFFWLKISRSESSVLKILAYLKRNICNALRSKYGLCSYDVIDAIKYAVTENFSAALVMWLLWFYVFLCLSVGYMYILSVYMLYAGLLVK